MFDSLEYNPLALGKDELIWEKYPDLAINPTFCQLTEEDFALGYKHEELSQLVSFVILFRLREWSLSVYRGFRDSSIQP